MLPNDAECALGIFERLWGLRVRPGVRDPVLQNEAGDAAHGQPVADLGAFKVDSQDGIAPTREDYDRRSICLASGLVERQGRLGDVPQPDQWATSDLVVACLGGVSFGVPWQAWHPGPRWAIAQSQDGWRRAASQRAAALMQRALQ